LYGLNPNDPSDANEDTDRDGMSNLKEYIAGTNPKDPASVLKLNTEYRPDGTLILIFQAQQNKSYSVVYTSNITNGEWNILTNINSQLQQDIQIRINNIRTGMRYYRVVTPQITPR